MDEISDLIRLLAAAPAEEAPMTRPKEMLDRIAIERAVREGVVPAGPAVPGAEARPAELITGPPTSPVAPRESRGNPSQFNFPKQGSQAGANPRVNQVQMGLTANPRTGIPNVPMDVKVMSPETFIGRVATPKILTAMAGMPSQPKGGETFTGVASPTPRSQVTITVPPAFPIDPQQAFDAADEQLNVPPRPRSIEARGIRSDQDDAPLESTEAYVARSYQAVDGSRSDIDRWVP